MQITCSYLSIKSTSKYSPKHTKEKSSFNTHLFWGSPVEVTALLSSQLASNPESKFIFEKSALKASWLEAAVSPKTAVVELFSWVTVLPKLELKSAENVSGLWIGCAKQSAGPLPLKPLPPKSAQPLFSEVSDMGADCQGFTGSSPPFSPPLPRLSNTSAQSV